MRIGIIGAGHAGVEAACAVREARGEVDLFSAEAVVPYFRPRLVALAFGRVEFPAIRMHPDDWYAQQGITLHLESPVSRLDASTLEITASATTTRFDGIVVAAGAGPVLPPFAAEGGPCVLPLWNHAHAMAIRQHVRSGSRLVVVGGGILGIEAALRALDSGMTVTIVELMDRLMPAQFGSHASTVLLRRLKQKNIQVILGHGVAGARRNPESVTLRLDDGRQLETDLCLVSIGARPEKALAASAGLAAGRGIRVDHFLQTSDPRCFAAGDAMEFEGVTRCSVREATRQGRLAGTNLTASLLGRAMQAYRPDSLPLMFRSGDFELYSIGDPGGIGYEEHLLEGTTESVIRSLIVKDGIPLGVQMIGTREGLDEYAAVVHGQKGAVGS